MRGLKRYLPGAVLIACGAIGMLIGFVIGTFVAGDSRAAAARAERLIPLSAAGIEDRSPGAEALVEGRIDPRTKPQFRDFVAFVREEYRGSDDDNRENWVEDQRTTPPILVATTSGLISVGGPGYAIENPSVRWRESDSLSWNLLSGEGTKRYYGLRAGDSVTAIGTVADGPEGHELAASTVYGGTRAEYIAAKRQDAATAPWVGGAIGLVGTLIACLGLWLIMRR